MPTRTQLRLGALALVMALGGWLVHASVELRAAPARGTVAGQVTLTKDGDPQADKSKAVIYLEGVPDALPDTSSMVSHIRQRDQQFSPSLLVTLKGSTVEFPNDDKIFHNVFSLSRTARFDLGLYKSGESKSVKMRRTGVVDVYCNIHPQMVSKILVLDTKYHAVTTANGKYSIDGVPPGEYTLVAWYSDGKERRSKVRIEANKTVQLNLTIEMGETDTTHRRKDGTPYGRYE